MEIVRTHIVLETYECDSTKGHTETNVIQSIRKVYELESGSYVIENPRGAHHLQTISRQDFRKMRMDFMTYSDVITYERDNYLDEDNDENEYR